MNGMEIIAITPFTGSEKLVKMTEDCIEQLMRSRVPMGTQIRILAVNNAASRPVDLDKLNALALTHEHLHDVDELKLDKNEGFGIGVNKGLDYMLIGNRWPCDYVLIFNNDLQFPHQDWLLKMIWELEHGFVCSPCTDVTATKEAVADGPMDGIPRRSAEVSAYCWMLSKRTIDAIDTRFGWPLFCPQFSNYGSDDAAAAVLRKLYGGTPFKIVPRAFVKHLKAQTANELGVKAGTKELLADLKKWKRANHLT